MPTLVLLRHGESDWNRQNRFTGWTDVDLSPLGCEQARRAAHVLRKHHLRFNVAYTSVLKRAIRTLWIMMDELELMWVPVEKCWRLNERHYGALQGMNKAEVSAELGEEQVERWRRSYEERPPVVRESDERYPGHDSRYRHLRPDELPCAESLKDTASRLWPCWQHSIAPALRQHEKVLIVAHGNSLRALVKYLQNISDSGIADLEIPCGVPLIYELSSGLDRIEKLCWDGLQDADPTHAASIPDLVAHS